MTYDLKIAETPRLVGLALEAAAHALENPATGALLGQKLLKDLGVLGLRLAEISETPSVGPVLPRPGSIERTRGPGLDLERVARGARPTQGFSFESAPEFAAAYREGRSDPVKVAERFLEAAARLDGGQGLHVFLQRNADRLLADARESRSRHERGASLGPLDGVPVSIKDELDVEGYDTTVGTRFIRNRAAADATVVARLRKAGVLVLGKVNMHEIGIDTSGFNAHHGIAANPYAPGHYPGGSSSGSAASVAAGFCPISIGADGGGSIRIPAALCGVVGLKATWSRISEHGAFPLCASVGHVGPIGATVRDVALAYAVIAGPDGRDPNTIYQPAHHLEDLDRDDLSDLRIGVFRPWLEHASPEVVKAARGALDLLQGRGAQIVDVTVPELDRARIAQAVTILSEMASYMERYDAEFRRSYGLGVRINLALARALSARDYVQAQRVRTRFQKHLAGAFEAADVLLTPTTALTAPRIGPDVLPRGESNLEVTSGLMRFVFPANLTGNPALTVPGGYNTEGHPIGIQLMGRPWEEHVLLRVGEVIERNVPRRAPVFHTKLLTS
jgi:Asp-tRNA(Asn)/Glu-tRNA(Gln) amidotransferase A subunit family amidase